jgi:hypothetical protein
MEELYSREEADDRELPDLLVWMRAVMRLPHEPAHTDEMDLNLRPLRELYKTDYPGFLDRMNSLEKAYQTTRAKREERLAAQEARERASVRTEAAEKRVDLGAGKVLALLKLSLERAGNRAESGEVARAGAEGVAKEQAVQD